MKFTALNWVAIVSITLLAGCQAGSPHAPSRAQQRQLDELVSCMVGSFSSAEQHARDGEDYFDIRLEMVRIWPERTDGYWLYVEQAAASALQRPYRQRVYHVTAKADGSFESAVYTLPDSPLKYAGAWRSDKPLADLTPADLTLREGCAITLRRHGEGEFVGSTTGDGCGSDLRGASYATSEVTITSVELRSWDRGFDKDHKQVWGATKGAYQFKKLPAGSARDAPESQPQ